MLGYDLKVMEGLATYIDRLLDEKGQEIYHTNKRRNEPRIGAVIQGNPVEDQHVIDFSTGDDVMDALFRDIIDPKRITGSIRRGSGDYDCNLIWENICRNGLGVHQYADIATEARRLILEELDQHDPTGEMSLTYIEKGFADIGQRRGARRAWVDLLRNYARHERMVRDPAYRAYVEGQNRRPINADTLTSSLPSAVTADRLLTAIQSTYMTQTFYDIGNPTDAKTDGLHDYVLMQSIMKVLEIIGTDGAREMLRTMSEDNRASGEVHTEARRILAGLTSA